jgi:hypothetical protein
LENKFWIFVCFILKNKSSKVIAIFFIPSSFHIWICICISDCILVWFVLSFHYSAYIHSSSLQNNNTMITSTIDTPRAALRGVLVLLFIAYEASSFAVCNSNSNRNSISALEGLQQKYRFLNQKNNGARSRRGATHLRAVETQQDTSIQLATTNDLSPASFLIMEDEDDDLNFDKQHEVLKCVAESEESGSDLTSEASPDEGINHEADELVPEGGGHSNDEDDDDDDDADDEERERMRRRAMKKLMLSGTGARRAVTGRDKTTSVGARRVGSASIARSGVPKTGQLLTAVRRAANVATKSTQEQDSSASKNNNSTKISKLAIDRSIDSFLTNVERTAGIDYSQRARSMGLLGAIDEATLAISHPLLREPIPGTYLVQSHQSNLEIKRNYQRRRHQYDELHIDTASISKESLSIRCATYLDDTDIAHLRLSVFSDFSPELRQQFCSRSRQVLSNRRLRGATCLVATTPAQRVRKDGRKDIVLGSIECSVHEFYGTNLGHRRMQNTVLYVTEVAVNPLFRRCGVGTMMMKVRSFDYV